MSCLFSIDSRKNNCVDSNQQVTPFFPNKDAPDEPPHQQLAVVTSALSSVATFFTQPSEPFYEDPDSKIRYLKPNSSQPLAIAMQHFMIGGYAGVGINKQQKCPNPGQAREQWPCDVIYFTKQQDQINYEENNWRWHFSVFQTTKAMVERSQSQIGIQETIEKIVQQNYAAWKYSGFCFYPSKALSKCPFPEQDAKRLHALFLFYQKAPEDTSFPLNQPTLYTQQISQEASISVVQKEGQFEFFVSKPGDELLSKISEIACDAPYQTLSVDALISYLSQSHLKLVELSDKTFKLYIHPSLPGGMQAEPEKTEVELCTDLGIQDNNVSDAAISDKILAAVRDTDTYSSVSVQTMQYQFPGTQISVRTRVIDATVGKWDGLMNVLRVLVCKRISGINTNRAVRAILGSGNQTDIEHLQKTFKGNYRFRIYISYDDVQNLYFEHTPSAITAAADSCVIL